jgi:hypothetical protein
MLDLWEVPLLQKYFRTSEQFEAFTERNSRQRDPQSAGTFLSVRLMLNSVTSTFLNSLMVTRLAVQDIASSLSLSLPLPNWF